MKYIYSTSQMSKLSLILHTFSITGLVASLFLTLIIPECSIIFFVIYDCVTITCDSIHVTFNVTLNPNPKSKK